MKTFGQLTQKELWALRKEVCLNSLYVADFNNSFGFNAEDVSNFFDGYVSYLDEMAQELGGEWYQYDSHFNLWDCYLFCDDYSWIRTEEVEL
jgi:hypothetical protein